MKIKIADYVSIMRRGIVKFIKKYTNDHITDIDDCEIIEIKNLRELLELKEKEGENIIILENTSNKKSKYIIEIYNDYRE